MSHTNDDFFSDQAFGEPQTGNFDYRVLVTSYVENEGHFAHVTKRSRYINGHAYVAPPEYPEFRPTHGAFQEAVIVAHGRSGSCDWEVDVRDAFPGRAEVEFRMLGSQGRFGGGFRTDFHGVSFISRGIVNNGRYRFLVAGVDPTVRSARFQNADGTRAEHHQFDARPTFELAVLVLGPVTAWPHLLEVELANGEIVRQKVSFPS